jgi:L-malate glycosyltransferase
VLIVLQIVIAPQVRQAGRRISVTGPERRAANLAPQWREHGIEPVVCYPQRGNLRDKFIGAGLKVIDFEIGSILNLPAAKRIAAVAREHEVQLIHTQGPPSLDTLACFGGRLAGVPVVITRPSMIEDQITYSPLRRRLYSLIGRATVLRLARRIIAVSGAGYQHLRHYCGAEERRLQLIYNGIDPSRFPVRQHNDNRGEPRSPPVVIGMVAQLLPSKGWPDFIEVIGRLRRQGLNVLGLIVGEGELREALEADVARRGLQRHMEFSGFCDDVASLYQRMNLFLFTTHREGLSVAVIETLASGLPIVATEVGGIREQVEEGRNGYVVQVGDLNAMVHQCTKLIRDPALRAAMGRVSREIAEGRFRERRMLEQYVNCYREVAAEGAAGSART